MNLEGTVVNGMILLDGNPRLPEGARVWVELEEPLEYPHPMASYDREKELALLRGRIAETKAGAPGIPLREGMAQIAAESNLPRVSHWCLVG